MTLQQEAAIARFWSNVDKNGPVSEFAPHLGSCWMWTGKAYEFNRGSGFVYGGASFRWERLAHRAAYKLTVGAIPRGLELDHLCRVHLCVNPDHLEPVTHRENLRRGKGGALRPSRVSGRHLV